MLEQSKKLGKSAQLKQAITLNVHLVPGNPATRFLLANYAATNVVQGVTYVDFGFIEPAFLRALGRTIRQNKPIPKSVRGVCVARIALSPELPGCLSQQFQRADACLRRQAMPPKGEPKEQTGSGDVSRPCRPQTAERVVANAASTERVRLKRGTATSCEVSWQSHWGDLGKTRGKCSIRAAEE